MWRLGLSGGGAGGGGGGGEAYPERSNEPDRGAAFAGTVQDVGLITREIVERCWRCERRSWRRWSFTGENGTTGLSGFHFMRTGTCKYGASCKYHHPRQGGGGSVAPVAGVFKEFGF
ncbi:zinc finger CCCH domain-containing protein 34-like [Raphanus sativus]|uniref:Zinc finger CCCH domain-containing protein 34-like n=1 Tax=Raphanus sativus TaxID=3726 RepID=A0A9W3BX09_RAPSA|nr:zinc finger CCCH domain-containing protein 34-like [Raphanus sativus]